MAAAMSLGADAVYIGTRLIATKEAAASQEYKEMIVQSAPEEIVYTEKISGIPANWLKRSVEKAGDNFHNEGSGDIDQEFKRWRDIWSAGHGVAQIDSILPAGDVVKGMAAEYVDIVNKLPRPV